MTTEFLPCVSTHNLSFSYTTGNSHRRALVNLQLEVAPGELFGILGPNGSGKSTLFRVLSTLVAPPPERVFLHGFDAAIAPLEIRARTGVVFQNPALDQKLRVGENLTCSGNLFGLHGTELRARIRKQAEAMGIDDRLADPVEELSGGLRRRVEIAKALLPEPRLLILDEPSTGLDPGAREACMGIYRTLRNQGVTILLTTHLLEEAAQCDRVAILHEGQLVAVGKPAELCAELGDRVLILQGKSPESIRDCLPPVSKSTARIAAGEVRVPGVEADALPAILNACGDRVDAFTVSKPGLADVFAQRTGITMAEAEELAETA